jgi:hypothetical protein
LLPAEDLRRGELVLLLPMESQRLTFILEVARDGMNRSEEPISVAFCGVRRRLDKADDGVLTLLPLLAVE